MKCFIWFKEKKNKEPKLYVMLKGERKGMSVILKAVLDAFRMKKV
jgi:hypothetical protein